MERVTNNDLYLGAQSENVCDVLELTRAIFLKLDVIRGDACRFIFRAVGRRCYWLPMKDSNNKLFQEMPVLSSNRLRHLGNGQVKRFPCMIFPVAYSRLIAKADGFPPKTIYPSHWNELPMS